MNWTRKGLKDNAKLMLKKNHVLCCIISLILMLVGQGAGSLSDTDLNFKDTSGLSDGTLGLSEIFSEEALLLIATIALVAIVASCAFQIFAGNVLGVGGCRFYLHNIHSRGEFSDLGFGFKNSYRNVVWVMFRKNLSVFLWSLLFVIPGVVKSYSYRLVPYLLADNPELDSRSALDISRRMMNGEKRNAFVLDFSFILWNILSTVTLGIAGVVWVSPYHDATNAEFYMAMKAKSNEYAA